MSEKLPPLDYPHKYCIAWDMASWAIYRLRVINKGQNKGKMLWSARVASKRDLRHPLATIGRISILDTSGG